MAEALLTIITAVFIINGAALAIGSAIYIATSIYRHHSRGN